MRRIVAVTAAVLFFASAPARAQDFVYEVFGAYLESLRDQAGIPGLAAAIVDVNGIVWEGAYGRQDIGRAIATRTDTPFRADGLTQMMTAVMILRCAEEGRLDAGRAGRIVTQRHTRARRDPPSAPDAHFGTAGEPDLRVPARAARAPLADSADMYPRLLSRDLREPAGAPGHVRLDSRREHRVAGAAGRRRARPGRRGAL